MDLVLWRHAEAEEALTDMDDLQRCLTTKGERQAQRMGAWLERQLPAGARVLVSPAQRTLQTAAALHRKQRVAQELAPDRSVDELLALAQWPQAKGCVVVIGHQPTLGQTVARLTGMPGGACAVKKGAVWWLRFRQRDSEGQTVLLTVQSPDLL